MDNKGKKKWISNMVLDAGMLMNQGFTAEDATEYVANRLDTEPQRVKSKVMLALSREKMDGIFDCSGKEYTFSGDMDDNGSYDNLLSGDVCEKCGCRVRRRRRRSKRRSCKPRRKRRASCGRRRRRSRCKSRRRSKSRRRRSSRRRRRCSRSRRRRSSKRRRSKCRRRSSRCRMKRRSQKRKCRTRRNSKGKSPCPKGMYIDSSPDMGSKKVDD